MNAVFDLKSGSGYNDALPYQYQFPDIRHYREAALAAVGDWVLFRETQRNGGRRAYVAVAKINRVEPDAARAGHLVAMLSDYLDFPTLVPLASTGRYEEAALRQISDPSRVGQALQGKSVRPIAPGDFASIVLAGLSETLAPENARKVGLDVSIELPSIADDPERVEREVSRLLVNRRVRDANFRLEVCRAYDDRCAVTGFRIINGGGRSEVQAAHIRPVEFDGPDVVRNGIALSATVHWLFDRHLISIDQDYRLLVSDNRVPAELRGLFRRGEESLYLPAERRLWPDQRQLAYHRERFAGTPY